MLGFLLLMACVSRPHPVVLLISWDTTRVDALSCYGGPGAHTPVADGLAREGLRFQWALSQAPTTLSSHTAIMAGLDAHRHGVVRNGFPVSQELPLLAERFQEAGWDTIGVVGSTVLEAAMGLDQGFRVYDDEIMLGGAGHFETTADVVTRRALAQVDDRDEDGPLFLFVHYFDAHMLWNSAPDEVRARFVDPGYRGPASGTPQGLQALTAAHKNGTLRPEDVAQARGLYLAEVSWMDTQLGLLLEGLEARDLMEDSLVVLFGDHGEILEDGDVYPYSHGADVDLGAVRVPLLMSGRGRFQLPRERVVERQVRLMDLGATILGHVGHVNRHGEGEDLSAVWKGTASAAPPAFAEATRPHSKSLATPPREPGASVPSVEQWPNISLERSVAVDGFLLIRAPWRGDVPELYRLADGQPEVENQQVLESLARLLVTWDQQAPGAPESLELSPTQKRDLEALGYLE